MGKTADLTNVQKTVIDILQKECKPQRAVSKHIHRKLSGREKCGRRGAPAKGIAEP